MDKRLSETQMPDAELARLRDLAARDLAAMAVASKQPADANLSRRSFLRLGLGGPPALAGSAYAAAAMPLLPAEQPRAKQSGSRIQIDYRGLQWVIDASWFGGVASLQEGDDKKPTTIKVNGGRLPGLGIEENFKLQIYYVDAAWRFDLEFAGLTFAEGANFYDWMVGEAGAVCKIVLLNRFSFRRLFRSAGFDVPDDYLFGPKVRLFANWTLRLDFSDNVAVRLKSGGTAYTATALTMKLYPAAGSPSQLAPTQRRFLCGEGREDQCDAKPFLLSELVGPAVESAEKDVRLRLSSEKRAAVVDIHGGKELAVTLLHHGKDQTITMLQDRSGGTLRLRNRADRDPFLRIPLGSWQWISDSASSVAIFTGRLDDKAETRVKLGRSVLRLARVPVEDNIRYISAVFRGRVCEDYSFTPPLNSAAFLVADTDSAEMRFHATRLDVRLDWPTRPPTGQGDPQWVMATYNHDGVDVLEVDRLADARLSLLRGADQFVMDFAFHQMGLRIRNGLGEVYRLSAEKPTLSAITQPLAMAEEAFFRQNKPDSDNTGGGLLDRLIAALIGKPAPEPKAAAYPVLIDQTRSYASNSEEKDDACALERERVKRDADYRPNDPACGIPTSGENLDQAAATFVKSLYENLAVQSRYAAESRLAFDLSGTLTQGKPALQLELEKLTAWQSWNMKVSPRALPAAASVDAYLKLIKGLDGNTPRDAVPSLIARNISAVDETETAIEALYRLQLSPHSEAKWLVSPAKLGSGNAPTPIWSARLDPDNGGDSVRVVGTPDFSDTFITAEAEAARVHPKRGNSAPWRDDNSAFRSSLDSRDRHELMILTSVCLPALMPIRRSENANQAGNDRGPLADPSVVSPEETYSWLINEEKIREGFYLPKPFRKTDLRITSLGADIRIDGKWEPPAAAWHARVQQMWPALTIESLKYDAVKGRDIEARVIYKGFLFPLGHRAALVKVTERVFDRHPRYGYPIAVLIQRMFITLTLPEKRFPAIGQPYQGMQWPVSQVKMVTLQSPDIKDPFDIAHGRENGSLKHLGIVGDAFWPRVTANVGGEARFRFSLDDDEIPAEAPLLFVDNTAAHRPDDMKLIIAHYNNTLRDQNELRNDNATLEQRRVSLFGQRRRYAESLAPGDTEFDTDSWVLETRGAYWPDPASNAVLQGTMADASMDSHVMDSVMEGENQPPFYPGIHRANIRVQSLAAMTGNGTGGLQVFYHPRYLVAGFNGAAGLPGGGNPSQLYLAVHSGPPALDFSSNGGASGGLAKPNIAVTALSRTHGPVGGTPKATGNAAKSAGSGTANASPARASVDVTIEDPGIDGALSGVFNAAEYFDGALSEARLLGLLRLKDIIRLASFTSAAPKLVEQVNYLLPNGAVEQLPRQVDAITTALASSLRTATEQLNQKLPNWAFLYPRLNLRLMAVEAAANNSAAAATKIRQTSDSGKKVSKESLLALTGTLSQLVGAARQLVAEVEAIAADPTPMPVKEGIKNLREGLAKLRAIFDGDMLKTLLGVLRSDLEVMLGQQTDAQLRAWYLQLDDKGEERLRFNRAFTLLYGRPYHTRIEQSDQFVSIFDAGSPNFSALRDALLNEAVGQPLMQAYERLLALGQADRDLLRTAADATEQVLRTATDLGEYVDEAKKLQDAVLEKCEGLLGPACDTLVAGTDKLSDLMKIVNDQLNRLSQIDPYSIPGAGDAAGSARDKLVRLLAVVGDAQRRLSEAILELESWRAKIPADAACKASLGDKTALQALMTAMTRAQNLRRDIIVQARAIVQGFADAEALFEYAAKPANQLVLLQLRRGGLFSQGPVSLKELIAARKEIEWGLTRLALGMTSAWAYEGENLNERVGKLKTFVGKAGELAQSAIAERTRERFGFLLMQGQQMVTDAQALGEKYRKAVTPADQLAVIHDAAGYLADKDRRVAALLMQGEAFVALGTAEVERRAIDLLAPLILLLAEATNQVRNGLGAVRVTLSGGDASQIYRLLSLILSPRARMLFDALVQEQSEWSKRLQDDAGRLQRLRDALYTGNSRKSPSDPKAVLKDAKDLYRTWWGSTRRQPAIIEVATGIHGLVEALAKGGLKGLIDFSSLKQELRKAIAAFVPTSTNLSYDWEAALDQFPPGSPIFRMAGKNEKDENGEAKKDLTVEVRAAVDLVSKSRQVSVVSEIQPFILNLFPGFDLFTLEFETARFTVNDGSSDFKIKVADVRIGNELQYLQQLAYIYGKKTGPYVRLRPAPLAIEAGYLQSLPNFSLGTLSFLNLAINMACELPLENEPACFRFGVSTRDNPFIISAAPYGGVGYFELTARATEIVTVSASFAFGAVAAIAYGPLKAHGRVVTGIQLDKTASQSATITGLFEAVGEGNLGCFSVAVCLKVSMRQQGGNMFGTARYVYDFKVGFFKVSFSFTVTREISGSNSGSQPAIAGNMNMNAISGDSRTVAGDAKISPSSRVPSNNLMSEERKIWRAARTDRRRPILWEHDIALSDVASRTDWKRYRSVFGSIAS